MAHHSEDHLKRVMLRDRATDVNKLIIMLGCSPVKENCLIDKNTCIQNWEHKVNDGSFSTKGVHELFYETKEQAGNFRYDDKADSVMSKMLEPYELSIKSYRGTSYMIEPLYDVHNLIRRKRERGICYIDDQNMLKQTQKPPDLSMAMYRLYRFKERHHA